MKKDVKQSIGPETFVHFECTEEKNTALNTVSVKVNVEPNTKYSIGLFSLSFNRV